MNPYESPETMADADEAQGLGWLGKTLAYGFMVLLNIVAYLFLGCLLYFVGPFTLVSTFLGVVAAVVITLGSIYWFFGETKAERHDYLRKKRRKLRESKSGDEAD